MTRKIADGARLANKMSWNQMNDQKLLSGKRKKQLFKTYILMLFLFCLSTFFKAIRGSTVGIFGLGRIGNKRSFKKIYN